MDNSIINYLRTMIANNPDALPVLLVNLFLLIVNQFVLHPLLIYRVHRLEKRLKHEWPMKFIGKL